MCGIVHCDSMLSNHTIPVVNRKEPLILGLGDVILMAFSLWSALVLRYGALPYSGLVQAHTVPFLIVFGMSLVVFYISGLYGRSIHVTRASLPGLIIRSQIANGLLAVALFYFIPTFTVTPKINLLIYLLLSTVFTILWRLNTYPLFSLRKKYPALVIGTGTETEELALEMNRSPRIAISCKEMVSPEEASGALDRLFAGHNDFCYVIVDMDDPRVESIFPALYQKYFARVRIIDLHDFYEEVFDRIPLSRMNHAWIMSAVSSVSPGMYDFGKRVFDIILGVIVGIVALIMYPFVALAIKLEDKGVVLITQERIGKGGKPMHYYKFRSMQKNETGKWLSESAKSDNKVTRVGYFLRKSRIDELPQALAVLKGDMSLIGPRGDIAGLNERLASEIPYYNTRTMIKPGLTGWAQINQEKPPQTVEENKLRLSYDLYYITHRSLGLDIRIALRTLKTLLSRVGM